MLFCVLYSIAFGCGKGFMYSAAVRAGWSHLPGRKGVASGLIISGFGFGGFFFGLITNRLANPNNLTAQPVEIKPGVTEYFFSSEVAENVPGMFRKLCMIWTGLLIFGLITITEYKPDGPEDVYVNMD